MIDSKKLLTDLQSKTGSRTTMVKRLEDDLRARCDADPTVDAPLQAQYEAARKQKRTALTYKAWREEELTQVAVAWVLGCVFVRFLEDNELVETPKLSGPGARLQRARDEHEVFFRSLPQDNTDRGYLIQVFEETGRLPGMREFFDKKHNPLWLAAPSGDACRELLQFWQKTDPETGALLHDFTQGEVISESPSSLPLNSQPSTLNFSSTRFLGDLYQDLSEAARKKYALLQTPDFIESFILDRTLTPAIETFGYRVVRLIDPTCGSGHFLLGTFARLFRIWQDECPGENPRVLAQRALDGVYGVDLNPFAVAIARFRLLLAALQVSGPGLGGRMRLKDAPDFTIHLAAGDSLLHGRRFRQLEGETRRQALFETDEEIFRDELKHHYEVEDGEALHRILGQQYHAVVGNPPYIGAKDKCLSQLYRDRFGSCHGTYTLVIPFIERFFDLSIEGDSGRTRAAGYVGMITSNSFIKAEFGKKLITEFMPQWELTHVIDTAGAYIPGHGTPTVILFGKHQTPVASTIRTVMGITGEPMPPEDPALGLVWSAILRQVDQPGSQSAFISVANTSREKFHMHPWNIGGGGTAELKDLLDKATQTKLDDIVTEIGRSTVAGEDDVWFHDAASGARFRFARHLVPIVIGDCVRDWGMDLLPQVIYPYRSLGGELLEEDHVLISKYLWFFRAALRLRTIFGKAVEEGSGAWFAHLEHYPNKLRTPLGIALGFVSTHNHFVLDRGEKLFNRTGPVIKLPAAASESSHLELLGHLNSSTVCFWLKQVCFPKGGDQQGGDGARVRSTLWDVFYNFNSTPIARLPIPTKRPTQLPTELVQISTALADHSPAATVAKWSGLVGDPLHTQLANARDKIAHFRRMMIAWQEELDWQVYEAYGLIEASYGVSLPEGEVMDAIPPDGIQLGDRAFEIVLARRIAAGEVQTTWFVRHGSTPITEVPAHWPDAYRDLVERRIARIKSDANIRLIEQPEYKRRWNTESWERSQQEALRQWLLARLEGYFHEGSRVCDLAGTFDPASHGFTAAARPHLVSANQLADVVQSDARFLEAAEVYEGAAGFSVPKLIRSLVESESVPALPRDRYKDSGLRKRQDWEETWALQRAEDAVEEEVKSLNVEGRKSEEELKKLIRKAQLEKVGEIPVPPKYAATDFKRPTYWKLRGKLDVPKERWISYPGAERAGDDSPLIAWAGWDHLQQAQALAEYFIDAQTNQGWPTARLKPLLAALADLIPWLKQWHNAYDPAYGTGLGDYFAGFLEEQCRALGMTVQEVDAERFTSSAEPPPERARKGAKKRVASGQDE